MISVDKKTTSQDILSKINSLEVEIEQARVAMKAVTPQQRDLELATSIILRVLSCDNDEEILEMMNQHNSWGDYRLKPREDRPDLFEGKMMSDPARIKAKANYHDRPKRKMKISLYHVHSNNSEDFLFTLNLDLNDYDTSNREDDEEHLSMISSRIKLLSKLVYKGLHHNVQYRSCHYDQPIKDMISNKLQTYKEIVDFLVKNAKR